MTITNFKSKKVSEYLTPLSSGKILLIMNHGLGDLINFMPIFKELENRFPRLEFFIGYDRRREFSAVIGDKAIVIDGLNYNQFDYVFRLIYPEPTAIEKKSNTPKPYLCNDKEIGLRDFIWKPFKLDMELNNENSKLVGLHFYGNTNCKIKAPDSKTAELIWDGVSRLGYKPFEIHINYSLTTSLAKDKLHFISPDESLRSSSGLKSMVNKIKECKYFIGVDSGPLYLATSILGLENCIAIQNMLKVKWYFPDDSLKILDISRGFNQDNLRQLIKSNTLIKNNLVYHNSSPFLKAV